ncbi:MAG: hypothetical protein U9N77_14035 [Thermodesulfobacteriota bacterium]|nr:hypothetical protein [Thermodesulfobacteriota bacterium]
MGEALRYNLEHMGDILFDKVSAVSDKIKNSTCGVSLTDKISAVSGKVKSSTGGISLTYKISGLIKEKEKLINRIGKRVVGVRSNKPDFDLTSDKRLNTLFSNLDKIQNQIDDNLYERKKKLYPGS